MIEIKRWSPSRLVLRKLIRCVRSGRHSCSHMTWTNVFHCKRASFYKKPSTLQLECNHHKFALASCDHKILFYWHDMAFFFFFFLPSLRLRNLLGRHARIEVLVLMNQASIGDPPPPVKPVTFPCYNQWLRRFLDTMGWDPSVCKSNRLHADILRLSFSRLGYYIL